MNVGIDAGDDGIKIAFVDTSGNPVGAGNYQDGFSLRTALFRMPGGWAFGNEAVGQSFLSPQDYIDHFKREIANDKPIFHGHKAVELMALAIGEAKRRAEEQTAETIDGCVVTVPATYNDLQKNAIRCAVEMAGIPVLRIVSEPASALFAYIDENQPSQRDAKFAVYDFGSSTFDVAVAKIANDEVQLLAVDGLARLGGNDISRLVQEIVVTKLRDQTGEDPASFLADPLFKRDLAESCEAAKIALGRQDEYQLPLAVGGHRAIVTITRAEFENTIASLVDQTLDCVERALQAAGVTPAETTFVMVGGTSRTPFIRERLAARFQITPRTNVDPMLAVCFGAALLAQAELKRIGRADSIGGRAIPPTKSTLRPVTTHAIGIAVEEIQPDGSKRLVNAVIVPKGTPVPSEHSDVFRLEANDQTDAVVEALQGEAGAKREDCLIIGEGKLSNLPVEAARSPRISVTVKLDSSTLATITVCDLLGGGETTFSVNVPN